MKYYPMHMHLHSVHQPGASMESHMFNAKTLGMQYIHYTDHDTRTGRKSIPVTHFDFSRGEMKYYDTKKSSVSWEPIGAPICNAEPGLLTVSNSGSTKAEGIYFVSSEKRHTWALLSEVTLTLGFDYDIDEESRVIIDIKLSQRPPDHIEAHYRYVIGKLSDELPPHTVEVPLAIAPDGIYRLNLTEDIGKEESIGGLDNAFSTIEIIVEKNATVRLRRFEIENKYGFNDVIVRQRALAEKIGEKYGVKPFVTTEISGAGQHKNCFTSSVPVINYEERNYNVSEEEAVEHILSHGGVFSYNHPFEANKYKGRDYTREEVEEIVAYESEHLSSKNVYGATLMEVGFPGGRGFFTFNDYLRLWDNLSMRGVFITGEGDSDSHYSDKAWFNRNNFASWIGVDESLTFPIPEESFIEAMKAGNVYMGDPVFLKGEVDFSSEGRPMGSVIRFDGKELCASVKICEVKAGWKVRAIFNGEPLFEDVVSADGDYEKKYTVNPSAPISFTRIEMFNSEGRCILLTNPIYYVENQYRGKVARERAAYFGYPRHAYDEERMNRDFAEEIKLPEWLGKTEGKTILHIGDTESYRYPFYKKLFSLVKPDVIIHTGDMSDEVKAGRMSEVGEEYIYKIKNMCRLLSESGAEIYIVPGNNDIKEEIEKLIPKAKILKNNDIVTIDGVECRVGHEVDSITYNKKWAFYGHGFTGERWSYEDNDPEVECRFNACNGAFILSVKEGKYHKVPLPKIK